MLQETAHLHYKESPYVVIAQQEWQLNLGSNARNLAMEFNKSRPVLYVNPALDINSLRRIKTAQGFSRLKIALGLSEGTIRVGKNMWVHTPATISLSINWLKNEKWFDNINQHNAKRFFASLKNAISQLGWKEENCTIFNDSQMFTGKHVQKYLNIKHNFYYIRDNLIRHPYFERHGTRTEPVTIQNANAVFANSAYLADYAAHYNDLSLDIGQGCELEVYNSLGSYEEPADMKNIKGPRIGYTGFLTGERLDIALLEKLAALKNEWQWIFIGPEETMFQKSLLHEMSNVHFLGSKKGEVLPNYLKHLDVCINPQLINDLTVGNYPRKIDEYLAMGKPTVATETPAMEMFLPHVFLAKGVNDYIHAIEKALQPVRESQASAAIRFAKSHTWKSCVDKIYHIQNSLLNA